MHSFIQPIWNAHYVPPSREAASLCPELDISLYVGERDMHYLSIKIYNWLGLAILKSVTYSLNVLNFMIPG